MNAHVARRIRAFTADMIVIAILCAAIHEGTTAFLGRIQDEFALLGLLAWVILLLKDGVHGRSPGKALFGLRVVNRQTLEPGTWRESFKRNLVFLLPFGIGHLLGVFSLRYPLRFGEKWAGTVVIEDRYRYNPVFTADTRCCRNCAYNLTGNVSGVCPECGTGLAPSS